MLMSARKVYTILGSDRVTFLQGLVTNDVSGNELIYSALLNPQGKYLADFFLLPRADDILLDVDATIAEALVKRLSMYKLRAAVQIAPSDISVSTGLGDLPEGGFSDPRNAALGWRHYGSQVPETTDLTAQRVAHCIPQTGVELTPDTYILEAGFERLKGVDFKKGCYVGQEVTARMKHKTQLRKGLVTVEIEGAAPIGTEITRAGKTVGTLYSQANGQAIAYLRFDRAEGEMQAGTAKLTFTR